MEYTLSEIATYLLRQSWQIAVVFAVVAVACVPLRRRSAHWRYLLWLVVLVKCLVPPIVTVPLAVLPQSTLQLAHLPGATAMQPSAAAEVSGTPAPLAAPQTLLPSADSAPQAKPLAPRPPGQAEASALPRLTAAQWIAEFWFIGAGWFALFALFKAIWTNRRLKRLRQPASGELAAEVKQLAERLGLRAAPAVWLLDGIAQPFVWGLLRGGIYLPAKFADAAAPQDRRGILTHELAHVSRWDAAVNALQVLVQGLFFFHPLIWWANRKIRQEREKCCDETAIAALAARPQQYGEAIVDVLVRQHETRMPVPSLAIAGPVKNIEERIKTIMRPNRRFYARPTWIAIITVAALAAICVPTGVLLTARAGAENGPPDSQAGPTNPLSLQAEAFVDLLAAGKFDDAGEHFDAKMKQAMSAKDLDGLWKKLGSVGGEYLGRGSVTKVEAIGEYQAMYVPCAWQRNRLDLKVVFNTAGQISGLWTIPPSEAFSAPKAAGKAVPKAPSIVSTFPAAMADNVDPKLKAITVTFDQRMMDGSWSWTGGGQTYPEVTGAPRYDRTRTTCTLPVGLKAGKVYWVGINSPSHKNFKTPTRVPAGRYVILFATKGPDGEPTAIPNDLLERARRINAAAGVATPKGGGKAVPRTAPLSTSDLPDVQRRVINKSLSQFPEQVDLSTPEGTWAAWMRAQARGDGKAVAELSWTKLNPKSIQKHFDQMDPKRRAFEKASRLNSRLIEVMGYPQDPRRQAVAMVFYQLTPPKGDPYYSSRYLCRIFGQWKNRGEDGVSNIDRARLVFYKKMVSLSRHTKDLANEHAFRLAGQRGVDRPEMIAKAAEELFAKIGTADYEYFLAAEKKSWPKDEWQQFPTHGYYMVRSDYPSFVRWICEMFRDNPIASVELGEVFKGKKEIIGRTGWPTVPYKVTLKDGTVLQGDLPFEYNYDGGKGHWHGMEGIDWHYIYKGGVGKAAGGRDAGPGLSTPAATVKSFTKAAAVGDVKLALACFAPDSHDLEDTRSILTGPKTNPMRRLFDAIDPDAPIEIVRKSGTGDWCELVWRVTFKRQFSIKGKSFRKGDTFDLDGNLKKVGARWLVVGI